MFEHHREPVIPRHRFLRRVARSVAIASTIIGGSLVLGILGYHFVAGLSWVDAIENAAMILSGMGPVDELHSNAAKLFAAAYALFSGIVFLSTAAVLFAPLVHRLLHRFHMMEEPRSTSGRKR